MRKQLIIIFITLSHLVCAQDYEISMKKGDDKEKQGKEQLERILSQKDSQIDRWLYTKKFVINRSTIPFSHPVITLNCNHLENDLKQLSTLLHEEFHWFEESKPEEKQDAINEFKKLFSSVPTSANGGARDEYSTYLHLIVCDLEFQAMTILYGEKKAKELMSQWSHYTWIYDKVLNDERIREINKKYGFNAHEI